MIQRAECPECQTSYTLQRLGARAGVGREYFVTCATCKTEFEVTFKRRRRLFRPAIIDVVTNAH